MLRISHLMALCLGSSIIACGDDKPAAKTKAKKEKTETVTKAKDEKPVAGKYQPKQEALSGKPLPALVLAQAWFLKDEQGKSKPGPARLEARAEPVFKIFQHFIDIF